MDQSAQSSLAVVELVPALNLPVAHAVHVRSTLAVAAVEAKPAAQAVLTGWHTAPLSTAEKLVPATQAAHARSVPGVGAVDWPWPTVQLRTGLQAVLPAAANVVPAGHAVQTVSAVCPVSGGPFLPTGQSIHGEPAGLYFPAAQASQKCAAPP